MAKERLVVVGNGMAGARTVEEILARGGGERYEVTVFGEEPHGNYNRILLSSVLNGSHDERDILLNPLEWYHERDVTLHAGVRATRIDRDHRVVFGERGARATYDRLIVATGSRPFVPPMDGLTTAEGAQKPGIFVFRTLDDCREIARYASRCRSAAVIGGGLLGLEAARGLLSHGVTVHVVHVMGSLMDVQLDIPAAAVLRDSMERMGIQIHLEKATTQVLGDDRVTGLRFKDGSSLPCDMVVVACGVRPNVALARACGLDVGRGIVVDDQMRTCDPHVYAVGECAQHRGKVYGLVAPLWDQARVLAKHLTSDGPSAIYEGSKLSTKLKVMGVELAAMGDKEPRDHSDEVVTYTEPARGLYKKLIIRGNKLAGAILLGDTAAAAELVQLYDRGATVPEMRAEMLFPGLGGTVAAPVDVESMVDSAQICNCNGVSKGQIVAHMRAGARTIKAVREQTRASTGCGSCTRLVQQIVEWAHDATSAA